MGKSATVAVGTVPPFLVSPAQFGLVFPIPSAAAAVGTGIAVARSRARSRGRSRMMSKILEEEFVHYFLYRFKNIVNNR